MKVFPEGRILNADPWGYHEQSSTLWARGKTKSCIKKTKDEHVISNIVLDHYQRLVLNTITQHFKKLRIPDYERNKGGLPVPKNANSYLYPRIPRTSNLPTSFAPPVCTANSNNTANLVRQTFIGIPLNVPTGSTLLYPPSLNVLSKK